MQKDYDQNTPEITEHTKRSKEDPHEVLFDNSEISDDESADDINQRGVK